MLRLIEHVSVVTWLSMICVYNKILAYVTLNQLSVVATCPFLQVLIHCSLVPTHMHVGGASEANGITLI